MPSLLDQQRALQAAILAQEECAPLLERSFSPRLAIYRHAYLARLAGALRLNYPMLAKLVGPEAFDRIAQDYAQAHPSRNFSIRWHGADLGTTLSDGPLANLARMEWALAAAFDAADAPVIDKDGLARVPVDDWPDLPLALHPSVRVVSMRWAVEAQWEALRDEIALPPPPEANVHALLVWRKELTAHWRIASVEEGRAVLALGAGGTLQRVCETLGEEKAAQVGAWFAAWVHEGMLVAGKPLRS